MGKKNPFVNHKDVAGDTRQGLRSAAGGWLFNEKVVYIFYAFEMNPRQHPSGMTNNLGRKSVGGFSQTSCSKINN